MLGLRSLLLILIAKLSLLRS